MQGAPQWRIHKVAIPDQSLFKKRKRKNLLANFLGSVTTRERELQTQREPSSGEDHQHGKADGPRDTEREQRCG